MKKRMLALLSVMTLAFGMTACGNRVLKEEKAKKEEEVKNSSASGWLSYEGRTYQ